MNWTRLILSLAVIAGSAIPSMASAQHHRHGYGRASVGIYFGAPWPRYYYPPVGYPYPYAYPYAYAPVVVAPAQPPVYIEQAPAPAQAQARSRGAVGVRPKIERACRVHMRG